MKSAAFWFATAGHQYDELNGLASKSSQDRRRQGRPRAGRRRRAGRRAIDDADRHGGCRDEQFATICKVAIDHNRPVRIGVNGGSLNQELVVSKMQENTDRSLGRSSEDILNECMVISALQSTELAIETGMRKDQIIISC